MAASQLADEGRSNAEPSVTPGSEHEDAGSDAVDDSTFSSSTSEDDDDDSEEEPLMIQQHRRGAARRMDAIEGLYRREAVLPTEEFGSLSIRDIYSMIKHHVINLSPDYQRDVVWPTEHVTGLIESLLRNMHVPELLFNIYTPLDHNDPWHRRIPPTMQIRPEGRAALPLEWHPDKIIDIAEGEENKPVVMQVWNCADGKQRMSAICQFMDNKVSVRGEYGKSYTYSNLPPSARAVFDSKRLRYGFFRELSDRQEREIFKRVQRGKALDKGEILNSVDSGYADWVRELQTRYLGNTPDSLRPRILQGARGQALTGAYQASRNIIFGVDEMRHETDLRRAHTLGRDEPPSRGERDDVEIAMQRFLDLTKVAPLEGEDRWPESQSYEELRLRSIPVPHRVWRLRPEMVPARRGRTTSKRNPESISFAPVELHILPAVVHHFRRLNDGDLLELVELLRVHIHDKLAGEVKDNSKTYGLVKDWIKAFKTSDLHHKYTDSGALADGSRLLSAAASFDDLAHKTASGSASRSRGAGQTGATPREQTKKRVASLDSGTPSAMAKKLRRAATSTPSARDRGKETEPEYGSTAAAIGLRAKEYAGRFFGLALQPSGDTDTVRARSAVPVEGAMPFSVPTVPQLDDPSTSSAGRSVATEPRTGPPAPAATSAQSAEASSTPVDLASGLSEKQRRFYNRVDRTAAAPPPAVAGKRPPPPPPPPPPPARPAAGPPTAGAPVRVNLLAPVRKGRPQYDERGREILAPTSPLDAQGAFGAYDGNNDAPSSRIGTAYAPGYPAENDVALSIAEDDRALALDGYGEGYGGPHRMVEQEEVRAAIHGLQHRASAAPRSAGLGAVESFAAADARAAAATGRRALPETGSGAFPFKHDPEDEDNRAMAALRAGGELENRSGQLDERDDEVRGLLQGRQRSDSRPPARDRPPPRERDWTRDEGWTRVAERRERRGSWESRRGPRQDESKSLPGSEGRERRTSGGDVRADRGWDDYRRMDYRGDNSRRNHYDRGDQRSRPRSRYSPSPAPRPSDRGYPPPSASLPPPPRPSLPPTSARGPEDVSAWSNSPGQPSRTGSRGSPSYGAQDAISATRLHSTAPYNQRPWGQPPRELPPPSVDPRRRRPA